MPFTPLAQLYQYFQRASGTVVDPDLVRPGDLFFAFQRSRPNHRLGRRVWTVLESIAPTLLAFAIRQVVKHRLYTYVPENRLLGNSRAAQALERGATYAIIDNSFYKRGPRYLLVRDVADTLAALASHHRQVVPLPLVGITGSNGKTTTKELTRQVLGAHFPIASADGNANGLTGVSQLILSSQPTHQMIVAEMGITGFGELRQICQTAQPTHGLITSIGAAHLRRLKDLDGVQAAKGELLDYLRERGGHIFLNVDDPRVVAAAKGYSRTTTYGVASSALIRGEVVQANPTLSVRCFLPSVSQSLEIQTQLVGGYNLSNILAALAVGYHFGVPPQLMASAIEAYQPVENRSRLIISGSNHIILDAYNANPGNMAAALNNFRQITAPTKVLILGDMWDLGAQTLPAHRAILEQAQALNPAQAVFIGPQFSRARLPGFGLYFKDVAAARVWYQATHFEDATILIKGAGRYRLKDLLA